MSYFLEKIIHFYFDLSFFYALDYFLAYFFAELVYG